MRRAAAIVGVTLAAHGCLLFTDVGGLDAEDAPSTDGGDGGSATDSGNVGDSVASDGGADAAVGCKASDAAFCVDFDDGTFAGHWTTSQAGTGTTIEISNAVSVSPKSSLHSAVDRAAINPPAGGCGYARPERNLLDLGGLPSARFSFDVLLGSPSGPKVTETLLVASVITSTDCTFIIGLEDGQCSAQLQTNGPGGTQFQQPLPLPLGKSWAHVELSLGFGADAPQWELFVNGTRCGQRQTMPTECRGAPTLKVGPGLYCVAKGTGVLEAYYDNVEVH